MPITQNFTIFRFAKFTEFYFWDVPHAKHLRWAFARVYGSSNQFVNASCRLILINVYYETTELPSALGKCVSCLFYTEGIDSGWKSSVAATAASKMRVIGDLRAGRGCSDA